MHLSSYSTLVLNADYTPCSLMPLSVIDCGEAITRVMNKTCVVVDTYNKVVQAVRPEYRIAAPSVVARVEYLNRDRQIQPSRHNLFYRDMCKCAYCGVELLLNPKQDNHNRKMSIDHVIPRARGGKDVWDNMISACMDCNQKKGSKMPVGEWVPKFPAYEPTFFQLLNCRKHFKVTVQHESWIPWLGNWPGGITVASNLS